MKEYVKGSELKSEWFYFVMMGRNEGMKRHFNTLSTEELKIEFERLISIKPEDIRLIEIDKINVIYNILKKRSECCYETKKEIHQRLVCDLDFSHFVCSICECDDDCSDTHSKNRKGIDEEI